MTKRVCSKCGLNRQASAYTGPRGRVCSTCRKQARRKSGRVSHLRNTYNITQEEYDALLAAQGGVCAGCGEARRYNLHVEHDHAIEKTDGVRASIRGLTCARCNKLLRDAHDNAALLRALAMYLNHPPARGILT